jgi:hypothetical protein
MIRTGIQRGRVREHPVGGQEHAVAVGERRPGARTAERPADPDSCVGLGRRNERKAGADDGVKPHTSKIGSYGPPVGTSHVSFANVRASAYLKPELMPL